MVSNSFTRLLRGVACTFTFALALFSVAPRAQAVLTVKHNFLDPAFAPDGAAPTGTLLASGTNLYGTTSSGGSFGLGTVFRYNPGSSTYTTLHHFAGGPGDGAEPHGGLIKVGTFYYGTTARGGTANLGTVYRMTAAGVVTILHSFTGSPDGEAPVASLVRFGNFLYGTTVLGGSTANLGTLFRIKPNGTGYVMGYAFTGGTDGANPWCNLLKVGTKLYGTASNAGSGGGGTVYHITASFAFTLDHAFVPGTDGSTPYDGLIRVSVPFSSGTATYLYGTTSQAGTLASGAPAYGTVFGVKLSGSGPAFYVLHAFSGLGTTDGANPYAGVTLVGSGTTAQLYGVTVGGGTGAGGIIFSIFPVSNAYTVQFAFTPNTGINPYSTLILYTGLLWGTTYNAGSFGGGTAFSF